jgi:hypothetical protein
MQNSVRFPPPTFKSYEYQLLQVATTQDKEVRYTRRCYVLSKPGDDKRTKILFSDIGTSYLSGHANRHNVRIWGSDNLGLKFGGGGWMGQMYQDTLNKLVPPILEEASSNNILLHQDGAYPYFGTEV